MHGNRDILPLGLLHLGLLVLDSFLSFCRVEELGDGFDGVTFPRLLISWRKPQQPPFTHCPLASHCQRSPRVLCSRCFVPCFFFFFAYKFFADVEVSHSVALERKKTWIPMAPLPMTLGGKTLATETFGADRDVVSV